MRDETQCPASKRELLYFKVKFFRSLKAQNPVFSETIILHLSVQPDLLRRYGLLQHAVRHIQRSCHRRCDRYRDIFGSFDDFFHRDIAADDFYFNFWEECSVNFGTTVFFAGTFLDTAAHNLCNGHTGDTKFIESFAEFVIPGKFYKDRNFVHAGWIGSNQFFTGYFDGGIFL